MLIRAENASDWDAVYAVNVSAFDTPGEASLVDALRERARPTISLVAEDDGKIVGHIMFSPANLSGHPDLRVAALGPMAVAPERQKDGIGSALVRAGLDECRRLGSVAAILVGHAEFYPRFGFVPGARFGIDCEFEVPEELFMVLELEPGALADVTGTITYHAAFREM